MEPVILQTNINFNDNNRLHCPVFFKVDDCLDVVTGNINNDLRDQVLSPKELISLGKRCSSFWLRLYVFTNKTNDSFNENYISFNFFENRDLLGKKLQVQHFSSTSFKTCHFESVNKISDHSALSICSKDTITGFFRINNKIYSLYYNHHDEHTFSLISLNGDQLTSCDFFVADWQRKMGKKKYLHTKQYRIKKAINDANINMHIPQSVPDYYRDYINKIRLYVELVFIADNSVYLKYDKDAAKVHERLQSIASVVNSLYAPLYIRVTLVWADIWMNADKIKVDSIADQTLARFVAYRKSDILTHHPNDNAHLITDQRFGDVIGKAYKGTMCSYDYSGGVIVDHSQHAVFVGGTVAHEMGHNFGMDHDAGYPNPCKCSANQCIMAPSSSSINTTMYFSDCSLSTLEAALKRGVDYCLQNVPKEAFGGAKCGNGVLEAGEECDCGSTMMCLNKCCVPHTCMLAAEAECADGDCCDLQTCKVKLMANLCRNTTNSCDLPEFCDGRNPVCPPNFFVETGLPCPDDSDSFCYEGTCGSRTQQCQLIWGSTGEDSAPDCYAFNKYGTLSGNCGYDEQKNTYAKCKNEDIQCGRLQCRHLSEKPLFGDPSSVFSVYNFVKLADGKEVPCRSIRTTYSVGKQKRDPGMVPDGAKCGNGNICLGTECRNFSSVVQMVPKCDPVDCNKKGVCNNVGNCHCIPGYGGTSCSIPGYGGSVNSGPATDNVFDPGFFLLYLIIATLIGFVFATYYCKKHKDFWLHKKIWKNIKKTLNIRATIFVPVRRAPPVPGAQIQHTHRFSWNAVWGESSPQHNTVKNSQPKDVIKVNATTAMAFHSSLTPTLPVNQSNLNNLSLPKSMNAIKALKKLPKEQPFRDNIQTFSSKKQKLYEQLALVNPATQTATCVSSSSSSNESEITESTNCNHHNAAPNATKFISNRQLMNDIKKGVEHKFEPTVVIEKAASHFQANYQSKISPPQPPPHRSEKEIGFKAVIAKESSPSILLQKPKLAKKPSLITKSFLTDTNDGSDKQLNVRQIAAKFNS